MKQILSITISLLLAIAQNSIAQKKDHLGEPYINFQADLYSGQKFNNQSCNGKITFLNFWFIGCHGCIQEIPQLNEIYNRFKGDSTFQFVGVTFDSKARIDEFFDRLKIEYPIAMVPTQKDAYAMNYNQGFPTSIILGKKGQIVYYGPGVITDNKEGILFHSKVKIIDLISTLIAQ